MHEHAFGIRSHEQIEDALDAVEADTSESVTQAFNAGYAMSQQEDSHSGSESWRPFGMASDEERQLRRAVAGGKAVEQKLTCESIREYMPSFIANLTQSLHPACSDKDCDFSTVNMEGIVMAQQVVTGLVSAADKRKCLPKALGSPVMQERIEKFLSFVDRLLHSAPSSEGRSRVQQAYLQLVAFQQGVPELAAGMADRRFLRSHGLDRACPSVCRQCDQRASSAFGFRCLVYRRDRDTQPVLASGHALHCPSLQDRGWWRRYRYSRQCVVPDWKESALQHVHVAAAVSCTGESILMSLNSYLTEPQRRELYTVCLATEQGNVVSPQQKQKYEVQANLSDDILPRSLRVAFNSVVTVGLASGLAGLRQATRGNESGAVDFAAPFVQHINGNVSNEDIALYGNQANFRKAETLARLDACDDVYNMKAEDTFVEGAKAVNMDSMSVLQPPGRSLGNRILTVALGGILSFLAWVAIGLAALAVGGVIGNWFGGLFGMAASALSDGAVYGGMVGSLVGLVVWGMSLPTIWRYAGYLAGLVTGGPLSYNLPGMAPARQADVENIEQCMREVVHSG